MQCFSLYNFVDVPDPAAAAEQLAAALSGEGEGGGVAPRPLEDFAGTVYLAREGLNAQFCVRPSAMAAFDAALRAAAAGLLDGLGGFNMGDALPAGSAAPFKRFRVVSRPQILTDGLLPQTGDSDCGLLDWRDAGPELSPAEWHQHLLASASPSSSSSSSSSNNNNESPLLSKPPPVLLDCRNKYESDVGSFRGAEPLGTDTFAESWDALDRTVAGLPKDTPVYTFCTGGIRCVKVNAYLKQRHGMSNLHRLQHGIIGYEKWLNNNSNSSDFDSNELTAASTTQSLFSGTNFIFDERNQPSSGETAPATHAATNNEEAAAQ